jgi:hypothetical protein
MPCDGPQWIALDNLKDFQHDPWQLNPDEQPEERDTLEDFIDEEFDPEEAYDRMVDMMDHFRINQDRVDLP